MIGPANVCTPLKSSLHSYKCSKNHRFECSNCCDSGYHRILVSGCSPLFDPSAACAVCSSDKKRCEMAEGLDIITRLPQAIIETILCLFLIEEAASTGIFSKEWRYRWTKIPKLVFCQSIVKRTSEMKQLNWWKQLSRVDYARIKKDMRFEVEMCRSRHFEWKLCRISSTFRQYEWLLCSKMAEFANSNGNCAAFANSNGLNAVKPLVQASVPKELPTSLIHLQYVCIEQMCFVDGYGLPFLAVLTKCCPNLEKIKLVTDSDWNNEKIKSVVLEEYSDVWLEHMNELKIDFSETLSPSWSL
ncbi:hypothetical protein HanIR_Chr17g0862421 [Helianthus annuus]|nr:hypothetical protein HanIR_Chr17g0862421 [Helianthus annuus]